MTDKKPDRRPARPGAIRRQVCAHDVSLYEPCIDCEPDQDDVAPNAGSAG